MKPIFPVNLCKLVDRLFTEFENADTISFACKDYVTIAVSEKSHRLAIIHLSDKVFLTDTAPNVAYNALKQNGKIKFLVGNEEAVSGLELEKSMEKLRAVIHRRNENGIVLLDIEKELLEPLKVLDSVF